MAQGTKCLHAIYNHTRKVKLKYQYIPPLLPPLCYYFLHCCFLYTYRFLTLEYYQLNILIRTSSCRF